MRALIGLLLLALPASYWAGRASGGLLVVVADCDPSPPIRGRKTFKV